MFCRKYSTIRRVPRVRSRIRNYSDIIFSFCHAIWHIQTFAADLSYTVITSTDIDVVGVDVVDIGVLSLSITCHLAGTQHIRQSSLWRETVRLATMAVETARACDIGRRRRKFGGMVSFGDEVVP